MSNWKQIHCAQAERALQFEMIINVVDEVLGNLGRRDDALARYGVMKVASYVAQVARAQALGFDPNLLRLTDEELSADQFQLAKIAAIKGVPVWTLPEDAT
jgi:hypothetical protein